MKTILNALDRYNELKERIKTLKSENERIVSVTATIDTFEPSDYKHNAIGEMTALFELNNSYIEEYEKEIERIKESIDNLYVETRDYKEDLREDATNTFRQMIENALSDLSHGYSMETFERASETAKKWYAVRNTKIESIESNEHAFAFMINIGLGTL